MNDIIPAAELAARRTAAAAVLADMLGYLLTAPVPAAQASAEARKLAEIRAILAAFDWEWHDQQLALEAIERIVLAEEPGQ